MTRDVPHVPHLGDQTLKDWPLPTD
jgi:hypothetical protein